MKNYGLKKNATNHFEPGGQIELSAAPVKNLFETRKEVTTSR